MCGLQSDNELMLLEAIHLFVEILDHYFENVCELDLVFNFHKVCMRLHPIEFVSVFCKVFSLPQTVCICNPIINSSVVPFTQFYAITTVFRYAIGVKPNECLCYCLRSLFSVAT